MKHYTVTAAMLIALFMPSSDTRAADWLNKARQGLKQVGNVFNKDKDKCSSITGLVGSMTGYGELTYDVNQGCLLGKDLMNVLSEEDQAVLAQNTEQAIATGQDGSFQGDSSKGNVKVKKESTKTKENKVPVLKDKVKEMPPLELIGAQYAANSGTNVRGGPSTDYKVVGTLTAGDTVDVIGKVEDETWLLIGQGGVATGFVFESLLDPTGHMGGSQPAPEGEIAEMKTATEVTCRTIEQEVTLDDGTVHTEEIKACQKPDGSWEMA